MLTLLQIAQHAAQLLGIEDAATVEVAKAFCRTRWAMLWNAHLWPQTRWAQTGLAVAAGDMEVTLDPLFELVTAVRLDAEQRLLRPMEEQSWMRLDASAWDTSGVLDAFATLPPSATGAVRLRLLSPPSVQGTLTVLGKRVAPALAEDSDKPTIPGADLALLAHVQADLFEWQRQLGKAQAKRQEASALQAQMVEQAQSQSAGVRIIIPDCGDGGHGQW